MKQRVILIAFFTLRRCNSYAEPEQDYVTSQDDSNLVMFVVFVFSFLSIVLTIDRKATASILSRIMQIDNSLGEQGDFHMHLSKHN